jgi:hypothetical protein
VSGFIHGRVIDRESGGYSVVVGDRLRLRMHGSLPRFCAMYLTVPGSICGVISLRKIRSRRLAC